MWSGEESGRPARHANVLSNDADVEHVLHHLAVGGAMRWRADHEPDDARPVRPQRWTLSRQDDNGVRVVMRSFESAIAAECARRTYEERGHKQLYSIERSGGVMRS